MKEKEINVRLHYTGQFQRTSYVCGQSLLVSSVEVDTFSYTVLMEFVKDYLHYTEIGGIYVSKGKKGGWQLVANDSDLIQLVEHCNDGGDIEFYIDNTVDEEIEPLTQMQPHVTIRPRKNLIQVSAKKPLKRKFVTTHQLREQQKKMSKKSSPEPTLLTVNEKGSGTARRKLDLPSDTTTGENDALQSATLTQYEKERFDRMKENAEVLASLGVGSLVASLRNNQERSKDYEDPEEDEYDPEKEGEVESDEDRSERIKVAKDKKTIHGPRTRSRANAAIATEKPLTHAASRTGKESRQVGVEKEKKGTSSYRTPVLKPTCSKVIKQSVNGENPGSVSAYLALRDRQKLNNAAPPQEGAPELNVEETTQEIVKEKAAKKPRGRTRLDKVIGRSKDERIVITLNADGQPLSDDPKILTELSNFVGLVARDHVSLTYLNWHVVPDKLKDNMWDYILARYIIPDQAKKWVYKTLNEAWRVYKSRIKAKHYKRYNTDEERLANMPNEFSVDDFKILLKYWGDEQVQAIAEENSAHRTALTETHTLGPKSLAQVRNKMKMSDPKLASPSDGRVFLETRERTKGRKYKSNTDNLKKRLAEIKKLLALGQVAEADRIVNSDKNHAPNWLKGRRGKSSASLTSTSGPTDSSYLQELTKKIKEDLESELDAKVDQRVEREVEAKLSRKVQENMSWVLKKLGEANPDLLIDVRDFCPAVSSDQDDSGTPLTQGDTTG